MNPVGSLQSVEHANATATDYQYDALNRLTLLRTWDATGQLIQRQQFHLGAAGHREMVVEIPERVVEYSYDALYRLTEEQVTDPNGDRTTTYSFDATGNRLSRVVSCDPACTGEVEAGTTTYVYDANDRLLEETGPTGNTVYTYDANGNTTRKTSPDGIVDYDYNADDRLTRAIGDLESSATEASYTYDAHGIRQGQVVEGITSRFLVDPTHEHAQVLEELDGAGNPIALYVIGHERISQERAEGVFTYHGDGLGSIRHLSNEDGLETDRFVYEAYGLLEHREGTIPNSFRYTGEQYDPNLGFYYLRARYYNPATGRFPTMDTYQGRIHEPQTLHKYLYVHADPVNNTDPSGLMALAEASAGFAVRTNLRTMALPSFNLIKRNLLKRFFLAVGVGGASAGLLTSSVWKGAREDAREQLSAAVSDAVEGGNVLFHYSDRVAVGSILSTQEMRCSGAYSGHLGGGMNFPSGIYATDIPPWSSDVTKSGIQSLFYGGNRSYNVDWFVAIDGAAFRRIYHAQNQFVLDCPAGMYMPVTAYTIGPNLMDP